MILRSASAVIFRNGRVIRGVLDDTEDLQLILGVRCAAELAQEFGRLSLTPSRYLRLASGCCAATARAGPWLLRRLLENWIRSHQEARPRVSIAH